MSKLPPHPQSARVYGLPVEIEIYPSPYSENLVLIREGGLVLDSIPSGNILPDSTAAPALQGHQRELEKHMRADSLEQKIQHRPTAEKLIQEGILDANEDQRELEKHMRADSLEQKIQHRPTAEKLIQEGILDANEDPTRE